MTVYTIHYKLYSVKNNPDILSVMSVPWVWTGWSPQRWRRWVWNLCYSWTKWDKELISKISTAQNRLVFTKNNTLFFTKISKGILYMPRLSWTAKVRIAEPPQLPALRVGYEHPRLRAPRQYGTPSPACRSRQAALEARSLWFLHAAFVSDTASHELAVWIVE